MSDLRAFGIECDEDGHLVGFQVGKAAALLDWQHRKEAAEFERLYNRLYQRKYRQANLEKVRARARAYAKMHRQACSLLHRLWRLRHRSEPWLCKCEWCGDEFTVKRGTGISSPVRPGAKGPVPGSRVPKRRRFCKRSCGDKSVRARRRERGLCSGCPAKVQRGEARCVECRKRRNERNAKKKLYSRVAYKAAPLTFGGRTQPLSAWARDLNIGRATLDARLRGGWSVERAFTMPVATKYRGLPQRGRKPESSE